MITLLYELQRKLLSRTAVAYDVVIWVRRPSRGGRLAVGVPDLHVQGRRAGGRHHEHALAELRAQVVLHHRRAVSELRLPRRKHALARREPYGEANIRVRRTLRGGGGREIAEVSILNDYDEMMK